MYSIKKKKKKSLHRILKIKHININNICQMQKKKKKI